MSNDIDLTDSQALDALLSGRLAQMKREYIRGVNRDLASQQSAGTLARNIQQVLAVFFTELSPVLQSGQTTANQQQFQTTLKGKIKALTDEFVESAIQHNRSSCALSNFGIEHQPDKAYLEDIIQSTSGQVADFLAGLIKPSA